MKWIHFVAATLVIFTSTLNAALVGSLSRTSISAQINPVPTGGISLRFSIGPNSSNCNYLGACVPMAEFNSLDSSSVGQTAAISYSNPYFTNIVGFLTNGVEDQISVVAAFGPLVPAFPGSGGAVYDTGFGPISGRDLSGRTIGLVTLRIDSVSFSQLMLPSFPSFAIVPATQANVGFTISVYDSASVVPEPCSIILGASGLAAICLLRRRVRIPGGG